MGKYNYTYPGMEIWDAETWKGRESVMYPLAMWLEENNCRITRGKGSCRPCPGAATNPKTGAVLDPDVLKELDGMGLTFRHDGLGGEWWIMICPNSCGRGGNRHPNFMVVMADADYSDPYWAMKMMDHYKEYNRMAAETGTCILYAVTDGRDEDCLYANILCEMHAIFHVELDHLYLDVSSVYECGLKLKDIPGFIYRDASGNVVDDPDAAVEHFGDVPVLDFTGRWYNRISHTYNVARSPKYFHKCFDRDRLVHSEAGREMAEGFWLEHDADSASHPVMLDYWQRKGICFERHDCKGEQWLSMKPQSCCEDTSEKLPLVMVYQEVTRCDDYQEMLLISNYRRIFELVGNRQFIAGFFALETVEDNDLMSDIIRDAVAGLPVDPQRVYIVGHSHNSRFAQIFAYNHPDQIAGLCILNGSHGLQDPRRPGGDIVIGEDEIGRMSLTDMPQIIVNGYAESDFTDENVLDKLKSVDTAVNCWQNRLRATGCPVPAAAEILAARENGSPAEKKMGLKADRTDIVSLMGFDAYIADVKSNAGRWHLRCVTLENMPHMITPQMPDLIWNFIKRFAREADGSIRELY